MRDRPLWDPEDPEGYAGEYNHACENVTEQADGTVTCDECGEVVEDE